MGLFYCQMTLDDLEDDVLEWVPVLRWFTNQQSLSHKVKKKPPLIAGHCKPTSPNTSGWATGHRRWCWKSMSCEKVSLCHACGDQANSYCHIKCKNFAVLLHGIVAHITKYVQGAKKRLTMITRMSISLFVWPACILWPLVCKSPFHWSCQTWGSNDSDDNNSSNDLCLLEWWEGWWLLYS